MKKHSVLLLCFVLLYSLAIAQDITLNNISFSKVINTKTQNLNNNVTDPEEALCHLNTLTVGHNLLNSMVPNYFDRYYAIERDLITEVNFDKNDPFFRKPGTKLVNSTGKSLLGNIYVYRLSLFWIPNDNYNDYASKAHIQYFLFLQNVNGNWKYKIEERFRDENAKKYFEQISKNKIPSGLIVAGLTAGAIYSAIKYFDSKSSSSSSSPNNPSNSNEDYAPQSMKGVEIVETYTLGSLAVEHAALKIRNKNNYDIIVSIELKQKGTWQKCHIFKSSNYTDNSGYGYDNSEWETFKVKANSIRNVGLIGRDYGGRPTNVRIKSVR